MTKREAQAILRFRTDVKEACKRLRSKLGPRELEHAEAYYLTHAERTVMEGVYGSAPVQEAYRVLEVSKE